MREQSSMEVVPAQRPAFQRSNVQEWSRLDQLTGVLEQGRMQTDHWASGSRRYGKLTMSKSPYCEAAVWRRVVFLRSLQRRADALRDGLCEEVRRLDARYRARRNALSERRRRLVTGLSEPDADAAPDDEDDYVRGVPDFWLRALRNAPPPLRGMVRPRDEPALRRLLDVQVAALAAPDAFELRFLFAPNELFTNAVLTKQYLDGGSDARGCTIYWRDGQGGRRCGGGGSFFDFFSPQRHLRRDYERGLFFRDCFLKYAVSYYCLDKTPPPPPPSPPPPPRYGLAAGELVESALDGRLR